MRYAEYLLTAAEFGLIFLPGEGLVALNPFTFPS